LIIFGEQRYEIIIIEPSINCTRVWKYDFELFTH